MTRLYYEEALPPFRTAAGSALASSTTLTVINPTPNFVIPAGRLELGSIVRMSAWGTFSNTGTPTLLAGFYGNAAAPPTNPLAASSAVTTTTGATNWCWTMAYEGQVRSVGTAGTIMGRGEFRVPTSLTAWTIRPIPETALATVTIDTTAALTFTVAAQWGTSSASNTITCHAFFHEIIN